MIFLHIYETVLVKNNCIKKIVLYCYESIIIKINHILEYNFFYLLVSNKLGEMYGKYKL